ncbi:MAG: GumC family protein [Bradyrhizobium sp.]
MNAPKFNFDGGNQNGGLPVPSNGFDALAKKPSVNLLKAEDPFAAGEENISQYRKLFFRYLGLALKYRWLILGTCAIALAIGFVVTFTSTPIYRATATIQIDREAAKVVKVDALASDRDFGDNLRFYQTQYDLLKSRSLADRVAADLDLGNAKEFLHPPSTSAWGKLVSVIFRGGSGDRRDYAQRKVAAASKVEGNLKIHPVPNSRLVMISFDSPSPIWARKVANGIAESFIKANLDRRYSATAYARNFLKERLEELKLKLQDSEKALVAYAEKNEMIATADGKNSYADADLAALNGALQQATTERIKAKTLWDQLNTNKGLGAPQILDDKAIQSLRERRAGLMAEYRDKLSTFKPAYPDMRKLKAQMDQIDIEIKSAVGDIEQAAKGNYDSTVDQESLLRKKIDEAKNEVLNVRNKQIKYNILKREADTNRTLYEGLLQQYKDVGVAGAVGTNNIAIIDRAQLPGAPDRPHLSHNLFIALILGMIASTIAIAVLEILDDTFKSPEEIEEQLGLAVLGIIPTVEGEVVEEILEKPHSYVSEAYRSFRTALQFSTDQGTPKSILITSARPGEGKSTTALALAVNFAQLGTKTLLIDADLRNPSQHHNLKCENTVGLANYLAGMAMAGSAFQETSVKNLYFVSSGPLPPNPAELLSGPKMMSLISAASESFNVVIVDAPPIMGLADAPLLSSMVAGTLLVMATSDTRRGVVRGALKRLYFARARIVGAVINKFDFRSASYGYGYDYGYGYGYGYGALEHYGYGQNDVAQVKHVPES